MKNFCISEAKAAGKLRKALFQCAVVRVFAVGKHLFLSPFVVSSRGYEDSQPAVAHYAMQAHIIRHSNSIQQRARLACTLHREWETFARSVVCEHHSRVASLVLL